VDARGESLYGRQSLQFKPDHRLVKRSSKGEKGWGAEKAWAAPPGCTVLKVSLLNSFKKYFNFSTAPAFTTECWDEPVEKCTSVPREVCTDVPRQVRLKSVTRE